MRNNLEEKINYCLGIDIGSSGIRILVMDQLGEIFLNENILYSHESLKNYEVWDSNQLIDVKNIILIIELLLTKIQANFSYKIQVIGISSIGPSMVFINKEGDPIYNAYNYAYQGAEKYLSNLPNDFQQKTGGLLSSSLPAIQLFKNRELGYPSNLFKITTINDYITWYFSGCSPDSIFTSLPNISYTGLYLLEEFNWNWKILEELNLEMKYLPKVLPLGEILPVNKRYQKKYSMLHNAKIALGTLDGFDAFWAVGVMPKENIIVGSSSTTGALRRWSTLPTQNFASRLINCSHVLNSAWIELIPFNNVGISFIWLIDNYFKILEPFLENHMSINLSLIDIEAKKRIYQNDFINIAYLETIPEYFPYIEGEPRGPMGRGKRIPGGFTNRKSIENIDAVDLYIAIIIGLVNMYKHNLDILQPPHEFQELRLTGMIAHKCTLFCEFLSNLTDLIISIPKSEQSVAWATGMRALLYSGRINTFPKVITSKIQNKKSKELHKFLTQTYNLYFEIYQTPFEFFN